MKHLVIGGTGTLGRALIKELVIKDEEITCMSRDELKQQAMSHQFPSVRYILGDIRDRQRVRSILPGHDRVYLVAALKHIDVIEENVEEAVRTNIVGAFNVANEAIAAGVKHFAFSTTDKALHPENVYGMTKGIVEKQMLWLNKHSETSFKVYRWGNVIGSRGSVVPYFVRALQRKEPIKITHAEMTRFWICIEDAARYVLSTCASETADGILVPPNMKAARVLDILDAISEILRIDGYKTELIGIRKGEKIDELIKPHVCSKTSAQYDRGELIDLLTPSVMRLKHA